jgi:hypothetical protein
MVHSYQGIVLGELRIRVSLWRYRNFFGVNRPFRGCGDEPRPRKTNS